MASESPAIEAETSSWKAALFSLTKIASELALGFGAVIDFVGPASGDSTDVTDEFTRTPQVGYTTTTRAPSVGYGADAADDAGG
jgi:hypothetical protein